MIGNGFNGSFVNEIMVVFLKVKLIGIIFFWCKYYVIFYSVFWYNPIHNLSRLLTPTDIWNSQINIISQNVVLAYSAINILFIVLVDQLSIFFYLFLTKFRIYSLITVTLFYLYAPHLWEWHCKIIYSWVCCYTVTEIVVLGFINKKVRINKHRLVKLRWEPSIKENIEV